MLNLRDGHLNPSPRWGHGYGIVVPFVRCEGTRQVLKVLMAG
jgi:hypothetical protein